MNPHNINSTNYEHGKFVWWWFKTTSMVGDA
jgi:hypothetical protein